MKIAQTKLSLENHDTLNEISNWVGVCGPLPKTLTLFMTSLQANS